MFFRRWPSTQDQAHTFKPFKLFKKSIHPFHILTLLHSELKLNSQSQGEGVGSGD